MASKRSLKERMDELEARERRSMEQAKQYEARRKRLAKKKAEEERKARTHRLVEIGAVAESVLGRAFDRDDMARFNRFLLREGISGSYYQNAMNYCGSAKADEEA